MVELRNLAPFATAYKVYVLGSVIWSGYALICSFGNNTVIPNSTGIVMEIMKYTAGKEEEFKKWQIWRNHL